MVLFCHKSSKEWIFLLLVVVPKLLKFKGIVDRKHRPRPHCGNSRATLHTTQGGDLSTDWKCLRDIKITFCRQNSKESKASH